VFAQLIFIVYMILVTLLLVNMLIAMMGHTYETVNESQKEWYRQVRIYQSATVYACMLFRRALLAVYR